MRWPWRRKRRDNDMQGPTIDPVNLSNLSREARSAQDARERASKDLRDTRARSVEVTRVTESLTVRLSRNHWAEMMEESFRKTHG